MFTPYSSIFPIGSPGCQCHHWIQETPYHHWSVLLPCFFCGRIYREQWWRMVFSSKYGRGGVPYMFQSSDSCTFMKVMWSSWPNCEVQSSQSAERCEGWHNMFQCCFLIITSLWPNRRAEKYDPIKNRLWFTANLTYPGNTYFLPQEIVWERRCQASRGLWSTQGPAPTSNFRPQLAACD